MLRRISFMMLAFSLTSVLHAKESGIFIRSLATSSAQPYLFQNRLAKNLDTVFEGKPASSITPETVENKLITPLFKIMEGYFSKANYMKAVQSKSGKTLKAECRLFAYCSLCHQSPEYISQVMDVISNNMAHDPQTKNLLKALDTTIAYASKNLKISGDKNYTAPGSFRDLVKRVMVGSAAPYPALAHDLTYLQLLNLNTLSLLDNLKTGAVEPQAMRKRLTEYFENDKDIILQEAMACPYIIQKSATQLPKGVAPKASVKQKTDTREKTSSFTDPPPYKEHTPKTRKLFFEHVFPGE